MNENEMAWLAGFLEGEGTFLIRPAGGSRTRMQRRVSAVSTDRDVLERVHAFPTEWPRRLILGWSPSGICLDCGEGRFPVTRRATRGKIRTDAGDGGRGRRGLSGYDEIDRSAWAENVERQIVGYACACTPRSEHPERRRPRQEGTEGNERATGGTREKPDQDWPDREPTIDYHLDGWTPPPTRPAVVLDPFSGTGTTAMVARALGRIGVSLDLSSDYCRLARWRIFDSGGGAKAVGRTHADRQGILDL